MFRKKETCDRLVAMRVCESEDAVNGRWVWVVDGKKGKGGLEWSSGDVRGGVWWANVEVVVVGLSEM